MLVLAKIAQRSVESDHQSHRFSMLIVRETIHFSGSLWERWDRGDEFYLYLQILFTNLKKGNFFTHRSHNDTTNINYVLETLSETFGAFVEKFCFGGHNW
jgi:hypothetical protein